MSETDAEAPKRRGRPAKFAGERTRGPLTVRLRDEIRNDLEQAAIKHGRSLSEEMESRMEASFAFSQYIKQDWGDDVFRIASALAASLSSIEYWTGCNWLEDSKTQNIFEMTAVQIIKNYKYITDRKRRDVPHGDLDSKSDQELAEIFAALGGLAPPRIKRRPVEVIVTED
ncbi:hypothetical protein [uncultured Methylobacterium sp.]|uniref:hypothetical protein n=1 Tax=uncultured Methylobacterium sp. TaxID=157278 RepID=UPI00259AD593|nr:hypothetical protein [uncultured Methylobacterium sp.]